jgi:methionyl-tRNA formyltransferase
MNVLILTNYRHEDFVYSVLDKLGYRGGLIVVINNKGDFEKFTSSFSYDIGISFMYQYKVPKEQIDHRPWINFHPAPLPEYKGRNLCYHAIMNGEKEFGATVHYMDEGFDTGDIIEVQKVPLLSSYTAETVSNLAIACSRKLFVEYLPRVLNGEVFSTTKNVGGTYYKKTDIIDTVSLRPDEPFAQFVRAVTYKEFYPKIEIGGVTYKIVREK